MGDANAVRLYRAIILQKAWRLRRVCCYTWRDVLALIALVIAAISWGAFGEHHGFWANFARLVVAAIVPVIILFISRHIYKKDARVDNEVTEASGVFNSKDLDDVKALGAALATMLVPSATLTAKLAALPATLADLTEAVCVRLATSLAEPNLGRQLAAAGSHQDLTMFFAQLPAGTAARMAAAALAAIAPDDRWWRAPTPPPTRSHSNGGGGGDDGGEQPSRHLSHPPPTDARLVHLLSAALHSMVDGEGAPSTAAEGGAAEQDGQGGQHLPPVGLENGGGTCYMNAVLQQLHHHLRFRQLVLAAPPVEAAAQASSVFHHLQATLAALASGRVHAYRPVGLWHALRHADGTPLDLRRHEDPHEFLTRLLASMNQYSFDTDRPPIVKQVLGGTFLTQHVPLQNMRYGTVTTAAFHELCVDVVAHHCLQESMREYFAVERMEGPNAWHCKDLGLHVAAVRRTSVEIMPQLLICHLKRFFFQQDGTSRKVNARFRFSLRLDMQPYSSKRRDLLASEGAQVLSSYDVPGALPEDDAPARPPPPLLPAGMFNLSNFSVSGTSGTQPSAFGSVSSSSSSSGDGRASVPGKSAPPLGERSAMVTLLDEAAAALRAGGTMGQQDALAACTLQERVGPTSLDRGTGGRHGSGVGSSLAPRARPAVGRLGAFVSAAGPPSDGAESPSLLLGDREAAAVLPASGSHGGGGGGSSIGAALHSLQVGGAEEQQRPLAGTSSHGGAGCQASAVGGQLDSTADQYELSGILMHSGTLGSGHCWSLVRQRASVGADGQVVPERWWSISDGRVAPWDPARMESECFGGPPSLDVGGAGGSAATLERAHSAYMLFYERCQLLA